MNDTTPSSRPSPSNIVSGALGGLVVLILGAVLIATGVIDTGDKKTEIIKQGATAPIADRTSNDGNGRTVADIYKQEGKGVVYVEAAGVTEESNSPFGSPQQNKGTATGSGFVVDKKGTIVTNAHVVAGSNDVKVRFEEDGSFIPAKVVGRDTSSDVAVLKIDPSKAKGVAPVPLGDSSKAQVGDPVVAIGNPFGYTRTVTTGIVSALQRQIEAPNGFPIKKVIQTDASINPGNSGGPLLDSEGRVVGINSQIATGGSQGSVGIGFAIPINAVKQLLPQLEKGGEVQHAYLGIQMAPVTAEIARDLNLPVKQGALIQEATKGGPAADAGLKGGGTPTSQGIAAGGDLIIKVDGHDIKTPDDVASAVNDKKPGDKVAVEYYRGNQKKTTEVTLGKRPANLQSSQSQQDQGQGGGGGTLPQLP
jgi:S1-C subfamily serine protease